MAAVEQQQAQDAKEISRKHAPIVCYNVAELPQVRVCAGRSAPGWWCCCRPAAPLSAVLHAHQRVARHVGTDLAMQRAAGAALR